MDRTQNCAKCQYIRMYDYGKRIYYCDHEDRIDDMGKLGESDLPEESPIWCPLRENEQIFSTTDNPVFGSAGGRDGCIFTEKPSGVFIESEGNINIEDIIQLDTKTSLKGKNGKPIEIRVPEPEYIIDSIF